MIRHLLAAALLCLPATVAADDFVKAPPEPKGMKKIFNGKDLTGWDGDPRLWTVKDGAIRGETTPDKKAKGNTFLVWNGTESPSCSSRCT